VTNRRREGAAQNTFSPGGNLRLHDVMATYQKIPQIESLPIYIVL